MNRTRNVPSPSPSIATAPRNLLIRARHRSGLSITSGPLKKAPRCIFTSSAFASFKGGSQPPPAVVANFARRGFNGTLTPSSSMPFSVTLEGAMLLAYLKLLRPQVQPFHSLSHYKNPQQTLLSDPRL